MVKQNRRRIRGRLQRKAKKGAEELMAIESSLRDKLSSLQASERELACVCLFNLSAVPADMLPTLLQRLSDAEAHVVEAALHACINASYEHAEGLIELGILQTVTQLLSRYSLDPNMALDETDFTYSVAITASVYFLLSALAESSSNACMEIGRQYDLIPLLSLSFEQEQVATAVSNLLAVVTEETAIYTVGPQTQRLAELMQQTLNPEQKALLATAIANICGSSDPQTIHSTVLPTLYHIILAELPSVEDSLAIKTAYAQQYAVETLANCLVNETLGQVVLPHEVLLKVVGTADQISMKGSYSDEVYPQLMFACLSCLQNAILSGQEISEVLTIWDCLTQRLLTGWTHALDSILPLLAVILQNRIEDVATHRGETVNPTLGRLFALWPDTPDSALRVHILAAIAVLGKYDHTPAQNTAIAQIILEACGQTDLELIAEALNTLFDVYSEENHDTSLKQISLLNVLESNITQLRSRIDECEDLDIRERAEEAFENLVEFLKYKAQFT